MNARRSSNRVAFEDRSVIDSLRGLPWWSVTPLAVAIALTGVAIDSATSGQLAGAFTACYFIGCIGACLIAARGSVFATAVQPPIIMTVMVPLVFLLSGTAGKGGFFSRSQIIGALLPLVSRFPLMAITTAVAVAIVVARAFVLQPRPHSDRSRRGSRPNRGGHGERRPRNPQNYRSVPAPSPRAEGTPRSAAAEQWTGNRPEEGYSSPWTARS